MKNFYGYTIEELKKYLVEIGQKPYNADQLFKWVYEQKVFDFNKMTNISKVLKVELEANMSINDLEIHTVQESTDGTIKYLFKLYDGSLIETVVMSNDYGKSICITSQVGCNMGCSFCASGFLAIST